MSAPSYVAPLLPTDWPHWGTGGSVLGTETLGQAVTVSYGFLTSSTGLTGDDRTGFAAMSETQKTATRLALAAWSAVANITFAETTAATTAAVRFGTNRQGGTSAGYAYYPSTWSTGGLTLLANDDSSNTSPTAGTYGFLTLVHEIGHALGLKHPGNYDAAGFGTEGPYLSAAEDNYAYSIMSYNEPATMPSSGYQTQPAIYDVAAIQYLYGANTAAAPGNDTYTLSAAAFTTIWDPNGTNTLDASAQTAATVLSLRGGGFSTVGGTLAAGVCFNTQVQVARGGSGADTIYANDLGDTIDGGAGTDTIVFSGSSTDYTMGYIDGTLTVARSGVSNSVSNVEWLQFDNTSVDTSTISGSVTLTGNVVYRFYNRGNGTHFYTSSADERDSVISSLPTFTYEGAAFDSINTLYSSATPVYRFYNTQAGSHFYTISATERDTVIATLSSTYTYEGTAYSAFTADSSGASTSGTTPLYRFYNTQAGSHFYTTSTTERDNVIATQASTYTYEGTAYYVATTTASAAASAQSAGAWAASDRLPGLDPDPGLGEGLGGLYASDPLVTISRTAAPFFAAGA